MLSIVAEITGGLVTLSTTEYLDLPFDLLLAEVLRQFYTGGKIWRTHSVPSLSHPFFSDCNYYPLRSYPYHIAQTRSRRFRIVHEINQDSEDKHKCASIVVEV